MDSVLTTIFRSTQKLQKKIHVITRIEQVQCKEGNQTYDSVLVTIIIDDVLIQVFFQFLFLKWCHQDR